MLHENIIRKHNGQSSYISVSRNLFIFKMGRPKLFSSQFSYTAINRFSVILILQRVLSASQIHVNMEAVASMTDSTDAVA